MVAAAFVNPALGRHAALAEAAARPVGLSAAASSATPAPPARIPALSEVSSAGACLAACGLSLAAGARRGKTAAAARRPQRAARVQQAARGGEAERAGNDVDRFNALKDWLVERGAFISDVVGVVDADETIEGRASERGVVAQAECKAGDVLIQLPLNLCFAAAEGAEQAFAPMAELLDDAGIEPLDAALAVAYAEESLQGENSAWWTYLDMLGPANKTYPCFINDGDLMELQSVPLAESFAALNFAIDRIAESRGMDRDVLANAWQLMSSRRFGYEEGRFMLPLGDLLNHSFFPSCAWEKPDESGCDSWVLRSLVDLEKGASLTFEYCQDPNHLLLKTSGFVVPDNPYNRVMVKPADLRRVLLENTNEKSPADFKEWRASEIIKQLPDPEQDGPGMAIYLVGRREGGIQWNPLWLDLVGLAYTINPNEKHWKLQAGGVEGYFETMKKCCYGLYQSKATDDKADLSDDSLSENKRLAIQLRLGQKELLKGAMDRLRTQLLRLN